MEQDFTKKMAIVVRKDLPSWQVLNTVAHISAYLGNKLGDNFGTGESFVTGDGVHNPRNTQYPIIILSADSSKMNDLIKSVRNSGLPYLGFFREMIDTTNDSEIEEILSKKQDSEIEYLGIGVFGPKDVVSSLTKPFSLWK